MSMLETRERGIPDSLWLQIYVLSKHFSVRERGDAVETRASIMGPVPMQTSNLHIERIA